MNRVPVLRAIVILEAAIFCLAATMLNLAYHGVMLLLALAGLTLLLQPPVRAALQSPSYHPETKVTHA